VIFISPANVTEGINRKAATTTDFNTRIAILLCYWSTQ
jgi:hypothetical protein